MDGLTYPVTRGELTARVDLLPTVDVCPAPGRNPEKAVQTLTAADIAGGHTPLRTARHWIAQWRREGWPRVYQVPRTGPDGRRLGGVQWVVDAADYDDLCNARLRPELPQAA